jgi:hypothetical protein
VLPVIEERDEILVSDRLRMDAEQARKGQIEELRGDDQPPLRKVGT